MVLLAQEWLNTDYGARVSFWDVYSFLAQPWWWWCTLWWRRLHVTVCRKCSGRVRRLQMV